MGIIAGIAVPVTIAVINRQKKNAAAKSAEAVVATMKQLTNELVATAAGSTITITLNYGTTATNIPTSITIKDGDTDITSGYTADEFKVENLKAVGSITSTYTVASATYAFTTNTTQFKVSNYNIAVNADGQATASSAS